MPARLHLADHLEARVLFARYQSAPEPTARSHWQVLWMVSQDWRTEDISEVIGYSSTWIRKLVGRYNEGGPEAMGDQRRHNRGAAPLLAPDDAAALKQALEAERPPESHGGDVWSGPVVARWMSERLGQPIGRQRGWETLRRLGYTPQRPRPHHTEADAEAQASFQGGAAPGARQ